MQSDVQKMDNGESLRLLVGHRVNLVLRREGGKVFFYTCTVHDIIHADNSHFLLTTSDGYGANKQLISLSDISRIEFNGATITRDRHPWKQGDCDG